MTRAAMKLNAKQVVKDIREGCDDVELMGKYSLSEAQLEKVFKQLLEHRLLEPSELAVRVKATSEEDYISLEADHPVEPNNPEDAKNKPLHAHTGKENVVRSHLLFAIFCLLWFFPLGIVAIIHASRVKPKLQVGDHEGAMASSKAARKWCWICFATALPLVLLSVFVIIAASSPLAAPFIYTLF